MFDRLLQWLNGDGGASVDWQDADAIRKGSLQLSRAASGEIWLEDDSPPGGEEVTFAQAKEMLS